MENKVENLEFFSKEINYSTNNEDNYSEYLSFDFEGNENVLCILSGGERFLDFLTYDKLPANFVLIDANVTQIYLFELKKEAFLQLDYDTFTKFIGLQDDSAANRVKVYKQLKNSLSQEVCEYWDSSIKIIEKGVLYQGNFEKFLKIISRSLKLVFGKNIDNLFKCNSIDEQKEYFRKKIKGFKWNCFTSLLCRKVWFKIFSKDPCFYLYEGIGNYPAFFKNRFEEAIENIPVKDNQLLSLIFCGRYNFEFEIIPYCYKRRSYDKLRERLRSVQFKVVCDDVNSYLKKCSEKFDCFSLSDLCSYLNKEEIVELLNNIIRTSQKGARVVIRELLTRYDMGELMANVQYAHLLKRNKSLDQELRKTDKSFIWNFYTFNVG